MITPSIRSGSPETPHDSTVGGLFRLLTNSVKSLVVSAMIAAPSIASAQSPPSASDGPEPAPALAGEAVEVATGVASIGTNSASSTNSVPAVATKTVKDDGLVIHGNVTIPLNRDFTKILPLDVQRRLVEYFLNKDTESWGQNDWDKHFRVFMASDEPAAVLLRDQITKNSAAGIKLSWGASSAVPFRVFNSGAPTLAQVPGVWVYTGKTPTPGQMTDPAGCLNIFYVPGGTSHTAVADKE